MSCLASCCASLTCGLCSSVASGISKKSARLAYCGLFGLSLIVSWILREVGTPLLEKFPWINTSDGDTRTKEWYQIQAVLRTSNSKLTILAETISKFGAGLFLLVQVIILLDGVHTWNDAWVAKDEQKWYVALLAISVGCYLAAFTFSGILFIWFNPSGHDCGLNVFFIVMTMILAFVFAVIALNPSCSLYHNRLGYFSRYPPEEVNGSLLPASVISVYCAYVCYTALSSEPHDYVCNGLHNKSKAVTISTLVLGMLTTVLSVLYSALRAGSSTTFLSPPSSPKSAGKKPLLEGEDVEEGTENKKDIEGRPVSYSYSFFHLIFALASMYSAMLLSGWTSSSESSDLIDVGWTSVWVRICSQWVTAGLYIWTLVAPLLFPDREFF
ncbi:tms1 isoform f [Citrus sinensis]|nr:tms1 isoform f [Citrus sinensis]